MDIPYKSDKFGLGFTSGAQRVVRRAYTGEPPSQINNHGIKALEDNDSDCDLDKWIFPTINGGLSNWEAKYLLPITFIQE